MVQFNILKNSLEGVAMNFVSQHPQAPINVKPASSRPSLPSFNSWDSERFSRRMVPTIDTYALAPILEDARRPSVPIIRVDESPPTLTYRFGWRTYTQLLGVAVSTVTLGIAASSLYLRLHHAVHCDVVDNLPPM